MERFVFTCPCHFGLEAVLKREIFDLGYEVTEVTDGRVSFSGDAEAGVLANICLRTAERVLLTVSDFTAGTFDDFFEGVYASEWERFIPKDGRVIIKKASSVRSKLFSPSDLQSLSKKAIAKRLGEHYGIAWLPETGEEYPIRVFAINDRFFVCLDMTGESLHKRGYRKQKGDAPISETLAAALIMLTPWHKDRILLDPFCGSGTFPIEAAMMAADIAPGLKRTFNAEKWTDVFPEILWKDAREEMESRIDIDGAKAVADIQGYDIDPSVIALARQNAVNAGVEGLIHFQRREVSDTRHPKKYGFIITNPPYGERLNAGENAVLRSTYETLGNAYRALDSWSMYVITALKDAEDAIGQKASKNRKLSNGGIQTYYYSFEGPKPPKRTRAEREA